MKLIIDLIQKNEYARKPRLCNKTFDGSIILLSAKIDMNPYECGLSSKECGSILSKIEKLERDITSIQANLNKLAGQNKWDAYLKVIENEHRTYDKLVELIDKSKNSWYNNRQFRLFV